LNPLHGQSQLRDFNFVFVIDDDAGKTTWRQHGTHQSPVQMAHGKHLRLAPDLTTRIVTGPLAGYFVRMSLLLCVTRKR
jgi:hypothetical protein